MAAALPVWAIVVIALGGCVATIAATFFIIVKFVHPRILRKHDKSSDLEKQSTVAHSEKVDMPSSGVMPSSTPPTRGKSLKLVRNVHVMEEEHNAACSDVTRPKLKIPSQNPDKPLPRPPTGSQSTLDTFNSDGPRTPIDDIPELMVRQEPRPDVPVSAGLEHFLEPGLNPDDFDEIDLGSDIVIKPASVLPENLRKDALGQDSFAVAGEEPKSNSKKNKKSKGKRRNQMGLKVDTSKAGHF